MIRWGPFELDPDARTLRREGRDVPLQPRTFDVLLALARRPDQAVAREELLAAAWPGVHVVGNALDQAIRRARAALGDDPKAPRWLVAVPKYGYRLVAGAVAAPGGLVGRGGELGRLAELLGSPGLVTVAGGGGVGKTRLLEQILRESIAPVVATVDAAGIADPAVLRHALARALGAEDDEGAIERASAAAGAAVLAIDDLDAVARTAGALLAPLVAAAPSLRILATCRVALGVDGERVLRLERLAADDAVALFRLRAPEVAEDPAVAALAERLDGLPLSIELAAARCRALAPAELLARIEGRLAVLADPRAGRPARHASLEACVDASLRMLGDAARSALVALSSFVRPFPLAAAEAVAGDRAADALVELVEHALVRRADGRFRLPDAVREVARRDGALAPDADRAHGAWVVAALDPERIRREGAPADPAVAEVLTALERAVVRGDEGLVGPLAERLTVLAELRGPMRPAADLLARAAAVIPASRGVLALGEAGLRRRVDPAGAEHRLAEVRAAGDARLAVLADLVEAAMLLDRGRSEAAIPLLERALPAVASAYNRLVALHGLGRAWWHLGRADRAVEVTEAALRLARQEGFPTHEGDALGLLGSLARSTGRTAEARALFEAALALRRDLGDRRGEASTLGSLGNVHLVTGAFAEARDAYERAVALARSHGELHVCGVHLVNLGIVLGELGDLDGAERTCREALAVQRRAGDRRSEAFTLGTLGTLLVDRGAPTAGAATLREALELASALAAAVLVAVTRVQLAEALAAAGSTAEAAQELDAAEPALRRSGDLGLAMLLCTRARLLAEADPVAASQALDEADAIAAAAGVAPHSRLGRAIRAARAAVGAGRC